MEVVGVWKESSKESAPGLEARSSLRRVASSRGQAMGESMPAAAVRCAHSTSGVPGDEGRIGLAKSGLGVGGLARLEAGVSGGVGKMGLVSGVANASLSLRLRRPVLRSGTRAELGVALSSSRWLSRVLFLGREGVRARAIGCAGVRSCEGTKRRLRGALAMLTRRVRERPRCEGAAGVLFGMGASVGVLKPAGSSCVVEGVTAGEADWLPAVGAWERDWMD